MLHWSKKNTIFIMASTGYARKSIEEKGLRVFSPYYGDGLPLRILREICFRLPVLPKTIWYNKKLPKAGIEYVNIFDVNITVHYLKWIKRKFSKAQCNYLYNNMVGKANNLFPDNIPNGIRIWTYDDYDSRKYKIRLSKNYWIREMTYKSKQTPEYDVFFVGSDKGRGEKLLALEKNLQEMGLKTKFIITKDGKLSKKKPYYQRPISYEKVIDYDTRSRAILNMVMENQEGVTLRDMEAAAIGIKLLTTNKNIVNKDLYNRNNVFILGIQNIEEIPEFLDREYMDVLHKIKINHTFEAMLDEITN